VQFDPRAFEPRSSSYHASGEWNWGLAHVRSATCNEEAPFMAALISPWARNRAGNMVLPAVQTPSLHTRPACAQARA